MEISESGAVNKSAGIKVLGVGAAGISAIRPLAHKESADVEYIAVGPEDLAANFRCWSTLLPARKPHSTRSAK